MDQTIQIQDLIGRRRDWTLIAVQFTKSDSFNDRLIKLGDARRWRLISLSKYRGYVPQDLIVRGALVDTLPREPTVVDLLQRGIPTVRIGHLPHPDDPLVPAVMIDRSAIGRLAVEHFAERGFKHIAYVGREPWADNQGMYERFAERAGELGIACHLKQLAIKELRERKEHALPQDRWAIEREAIQKWLTDLPKPAGLLCHGDVAADRYCQWALELGLQIPQDVAILGVGNDALTCGSAMVPLSSVAHDDAGLIETAAQMLEKLMAGERLEQTSVMVPPLGIIARQSTDVLAATDPDVVAALRFMWDHVHQSLSVDQIADQVGVSRSKLEKAFKRDLGRGINAEFQRRRLQKARELVTMTELPITEIAAGLSYSSHSYFCQVFKAAFSVSPAEYRQRADHRATFTPIHRV